MIYHLIATGEPAQVRCLVSQLLCGEVVLFGAQALQVVRASLAWEVYEQQSLWQLVSAEAQCAVGSVDVEDLVVTTMDDVHRSGGEHHAEVLSGILMLLRGRAPTAAVAYAVLSVDPATSSVFAPCVMSQWLARDVQLISAGLAAAYQMAQDDAVGARRVLDNLSIWLRKPVCQSEPMAEMRRACYVSVPGLEQAVSDGCYM
jgi:hypothetical protein